MSLRWHDGSRALSRPSTELLLSHHARRYSGEIHKLRDPVWPLKENYPPQAHHEQAQDTHHLSHFIDRQNGAFLKAKANYYKLD